ncbi:MAG: ATP-dependent zinc protease [Oceanospirillaceae bacterium]|nr:ATP-dependent zinc protease [Oceanospirillaceae bacterium]
MSVSRLPVLLAALLLSACAQKPLSPPPVTAAQLDLALATSEQRLSTVLTERAQLESELRRSEIKRVDATLDEIKALIRARNEPLPPRIVEVDRRDYPDNETRDGKLIVGASEKIWFEAVDAVYPARVDTGATTSSLSARDITVFERDGDRWVRFKLTHDGVDESPQIESPLVRYVRIIQVSADAADRRPVVALTIRLGRLTEKAEFTLTDRSEMEYPVLLGREFLRDIAVVDIAREFIQGEPTRPAPAAKGGGE